MLAAHFSFTYSRRHAWLVLLAIFALSFALPLLQPLAQGQADVAIPAWSRPGRPPWPLRSSPTIRPRPAAATPVSFSRAQEIVTQRWRAFHSGTSAPNGVRLETRSKIGPSRKHRGAGRPQPRHATGEHNGHDRRRAAELGAWLARGRFPRVDRDLRWRLRLPRAPREEAAPQTIAAFRRLLPLESRIIPRPRSGRPEIPFGDLDLGLGPAHATCYPTGRESSSTRRRVRKRRSCSPTGTSLRLEGRPARRNPFAPHRRGQREPA